MTTFYGLVENFSGITIPKIQRDYAQGREEQEIIRDDFLNSLKGVLCDDNHASIDLDFVYGTHAEGAFKPLDGQQRLTTLFLLHWYLAYRDGELNHFQERMLRGNRSRFTYEVRSSSEDFMNRLVNFTPDIAATDLTVKLDEYITNQPWYYRNWRLDPTIRAALNMLQKLHEVFCSDEGLYKKLTGENNPRITFQLLDLEEFELTDDLYIKMNSRGKPLTTFETFKARLARLMETEFLSPLPEYPTDEPIADFFLQRVDREWSDFFWPFRNEKTATFDNEAMNLVRAAIMISRSPDSPNFTHDLSELRNATNKNSFSWFRSKNWLDGEMIATLATLLEGWSGGDESFNRYLEGTWSFNELDLFKDAINKPASLSYQQLVQLAAFTQYLRHEDNKSGSDHFQAWMRVVSNLSINTDYNRPSDLQNSLASLLNLIEHRSEVLFYLAAEGHDIGGFFQTQIAEERIKAKLILQDDEWVSLISRAEAHSYFKGQIGFLLHFSGFDLTAVEEDITNLDKSTSDNRKTLFLHYLECAELMFGDIISTQEQNNGHLWKRALLAVGDYLPKHGQNRTLVTPISDKPWGWKRLLRDAAIHTHSGETLKKLWDHLKGIGDYQADLEKIITEVDEVESWRQAIISTPAVYEYAQRGMLRLISDDNVYLLRLTQTNGAHAQLFVFCLYEAIKEKAEQYGFTIAHDDKIGTHGPESYITLGSSFRQQDVTFYLNLIDYFGEENEAQYEIYLGHIENPPTGLIKILEGFGYELKESGYEDDDGEYWTKYLQREDMQHHVLSLIQAVAQ